MYVVYVATSYITARLVAEDGKFNILHCLTGQHVRPILESIQVQT